ncbi:hypothetical protein CC1G_14748 [Coprinopsis cinerea okayama7|uniref:Uncharacterized protein n=1 Tax=Coprinopsis cinerea (strain Okayama-7 / 130 / ATCC MYA-4618 / FGSC 9003) TaxID=240176 RepID=D6RNG4_COPC7|nr:hypothetical protein CC1G_14748 [Coprinopsis cinerea okayama7\|eukprot:XP_002910771.1 hypothetical protein CC1G_14748 [Coprinopsis cinerea okayama7\
MSNSPASQSPVSQSTSPKFQKRTQYLYLTRSSSCLPALPDHYTGITPISSEKHIPTM